MTHFHNKAIREALTKIAPDEKEKLATMEFGEITGSSVSNAVFLLPLSCELM